MNWIGSVWALIACTVGVQGAALKEFPVKSGEFHNVAHQVLYEKYEAAANSSLAAYRAKGASLKKSAFDAAGRLAKKFQTEGRLDEFLLAEALAKRLDPASESTPTLKKNEADPAETRELKAMWARKQREFREAESKAQGALAVSYGRALAPLSDAFLRDSEFRAAKALEDESRRLVERYGEKVEAAVGSPAPAKPAPEAVEGRFYVVKGDDEWSLYVNGTHISFDDAKSRRVELAVGDLVVVKYGTHGRRSIRMAFVSNDWKRAIHLRAGDLKVLDDGDPSEVTAAMIAASTRHPKHSSVDGSRRKKWYSYDMIGSKDGGSRWV